jgi:hypothetical protein
VNAVLSFVTALARSEGAQLDVAAVEAGQLGEPQAGLNGQRGQGPVAAACPAVQIRRAEQGPALLRVQERHHCLVETL